MEYMSISEAAEKWGITKRRVQVLCASNRIPGTARLGKVWAIPRSAVKPSDPRKQKCASEHFYQATRPDGRRK